jgi:hypothetical protein
LPRPAANPVIRYNSFSDRNEAGEGFRSYAERMENLLLPGEGDTEP